MSELCGRAAEGRKAAAKLGNQQSAEPSTVAAEKLCIAKLCCCLLLSAAACGTVAQLLSLFTAASLSPQALRAS